MICLLFVFNVFFFLEDTALELEQDAVIHFHPRHLQLKTLID